MDFKKIKAPTTTVTYDRDKIDNTTDNIYKAISIISKNGADGIISVAANAYPTEFNDIIKQINSNNFNVDDSNFFLKEFIKLIFDECNPSGIKYALNSLSLCSETVRLPLDLISDSLKERIDKFINCRAPQNI